MARMFCTLKEASAWLRTPEPDLRTMLDQGLLAEFREGDNRLLRISDVRALAIARSAQNRQPSVARPPSPAPAQPPMPAPQTAVAPDIRLPRTGTALLDPPDPDIETWELPEIEPVERDRDIYRPQPAPRRESRMPRPTTPEWTNPWPRSFAEQPLARKGLWTGVLDDRPLAIVAVSAIVVAGLAAVASGVYVLVRFLQ